MYDALYTLHKITYIDVFITLLNICKYVCFIFTYIGFLAVILLLIYDDWFCDKFETIRSLTVIFYQIYTHIYIYIVKDTNNS